MTRQSVHNLQEHIANFTEDFEAYSVAKLKSDDAQIAVVNFESSGERWISLICEDGAGEVSQMNIVGDKAIKALEKVLSAK